LTPNQAFLFLYNYERLFVYNRDGGTKEVTEMAIRDRGKLKWRPASFIPLAFEMQREMFKDQERLSKPILDVYETEEFDQNIAFAMEYNLAVKLTVWADGFTKEMTGHIHKVTPFTHQLRVEVKPGEFENVAFEDVIGVVVLD
jgi:hypothetical protein